MAEAITLARVDREQFSLHPEDDMTESLYHGVQAVYFAEAFSEALPGLFAARNLAVYWVPGQRKHPYAGPDVLVSRFHPPQPDPTVYLTYEDGPLTLVVAIVFFMFEVVLIATLQAFIFATLAAIYLGGAVAEAH